MNGIVNIFSFSSIPFLYFYISSFFILQHRLILMLGSVRISHRYIRKVDSSRHISLQKSTTTQQKCLKWAQTRQRQTGWVRQMDRVNRCATLNCQYFLAATNRPNIQNRIGSMHHESVHLMRCL